VNRGLINCLILDLLKKKEKNLGPQNFISFRCLLTLNLGFFPLSSTVFIEICFGGHLEKKIFTKVKDQK
jgi:hypothetical protein